MLCSTFMQWRLRRPWLASSLLHVANHDPWGVAIRRGALAQPRWLLKLTGWLGRSTARARVVAAMRQWVQSCRQQAFALLSQHTAARHILSSVWRRWKTTVAAEQLTDLAKALGRQQLRLRALSGWRTAGAACGGGCSWLDALKATLNAGQLRRISQRGVSVLHAAATNGRLQAAAAQHASSLSLRSAWRAIMAAALVQRRLALCACALAQRTTVARFATWSAGWRANAQRAAAATFGGGGIMDDAEATPDPFQ